MMPLLTPFSSLQGHWVKVAMIEMPRFDAEDDSERKAIKTQYEQQLQMIKLTKMTTQIPIKMPTIHHNQLRSTSKDTFCEALCLWSL